MEANLDENEIHRLEQELGTEILPGTEIMTGAVFALLNVASHHFVKAGSGSHTVLVPQPSDNEDDPLNWSPLWKGLTMFCAALVSFSQGFGPLAIAPMIDDYIVAYDSNLADVVQFNGIAILALGFSNFIWVPMMTCFGRRPTLIVSTTICFASSIWRARAISYSSFMGACILNGIGAGPAETAQPVIIADIIFLHDRGKYQTLYFASYYGSLTVGTMISGSIANALGPQSFWWLNTAHLGFTVLCCVFLFPETKYNRTYALSSVKVSSGVVPAKSSSEQGKGTDATATEDVISIKNLDIHNSRAIVHIHQDPCIGRGKPSKRQWALWQTYQGPGSVFRKILYEIWLPWQLFAFPIVDFASFVASWSASFFLATNLTQSQVFAAPPYNFSSQTIGFFNFATLVGAGIALLTTGPLSDAIAARLTTRNRGIREPEMRLLTMIPYVPIMVLGNIVMALGYEYHWDWRLIVIIGYTCAGIQATALPAITTTYAIDSYKPVAGSLFVIITVTKNLWGYGFSKFITPWSESAGFIPPLMTNMALTTFFCSTGVIFWFYGKTFRRWSKDSHAHRM